MEYTFRRHFYYEVEKSVNDNHVTILLGPRKCGKTVCLKQLAAELQNAAYYDLKRMDEDDGIELRAMIIDSIHADEKKIYLIDEVTYFLFPEKTIAAIAGEMFSCRNTNTRVVFAGSQSVALEVWANRAFAGNAVLIHTDFLAYPEWLAYMGIREISEETYNQFILGTRDFYTDFVSLDQYLKGCLEETIISNLKTSNVIWDNGCDRLNETILKNILYAALAAQHDRPGIESFFDPDKIFKKIRNTLKDAYKAIGCEKLYQRVAKIFTNRLEAYTTLDMETFRQGLIFLYRSGLITLTYVSEEKENFENIVDVYMDFRRSDGNRIKNKEDLFKYVNISIKYPMFYVEILKEVLLDEMPDVVKGDILGGIVECHVRGILPHECSYEYHDDKSQREVDYVNFACREAIEISVRNKSRGELCFSDLPDVFSKILLTKNQDYTEEDGLVRIPYYKYIFDHSEGRDVFFVMEEMQKELEDSFDR